jgi:o-succinylbenzoate synthase
MAATAALPWRPFAGRIAARREKSACAFGSDAIHCDSFRMSSAPVVYRFAFRPYRLRLRATVRTAHEVWTERAGGLIRLEDEHGHAGYGEAAPIPAFGTETIDDIVAACSTLGAHVGAAEFEAMPLRLGCLRSAIASARADLTDVANQASSPADAAEAYRGVAALLPAGKPALQQVRDKAEAGFRVFKWKVGVGDAADELALLDDVCAALPNGAKLRLDANGGWDRKRAERWLERCAERPVELVEQPCFSPASAGEPAARRTDELLLGLAHEYPTPIALDESLVGDGDVARWLERGWPGWYVIKPSLLGDGAGALRRLETAKATVVFSSALETAVGARAALRLAFAWRGEAKALGFGVWPLFSDARFDGPGAAPFIRASDVRRIKPETVWNALS